jgi:tripartite-type tricarboxylate transporter receptor subunit TctC
MIKVKSIFVAMLLCVMLILMAGLTNQVVGAEKYPTRAIDIIVPFGQGGSTDLATRILADELKKMWGVPVNVVNKLGGNGIPGTMEAQYLPTPSLPARGCRSSLRQVQLQFPKGLILL